MTMNEHSNEKKNKEKRRKSLGHGYSCRFSKGMTAAFGAAAAGLFVTGMLLPLRPTYSNAEKRSLKTFPKVSVETVLDGRFFTDLSGWYSDTFPFRESLLSAGSAVKTLYGIQGEAYYGNKKAVVADELPSEAETPAPTLSLEDEKETAAATASEVESTEETEQDFTVETNPDGTMLLPDKPKEEVTLTGEQAGNIYVANNKGYEIYYFNQENAQIYASMINTVQAKFPDVNVYDMLVPNSFGVELDKSVQGKLGSSVMEEAFTYIYSMLDKKVKKVPVFDTLKEHKNEYIYFNTDHHWTGLGAYYAYRKFCEVKGIKAHELSEYEKLRFPGFYGTFYFATNRSPALKANPDTVEAWVPIATNEMNYVTKAGDTMKAKVVNDVSKSDAGNKYNCFLLGDNPLSVVHNSSLNDGSSILLIKESYGNAFVPYLVDHYEDVYVVDYRYFQDNASELITQYKVQDILFLNNVMAIGKKTSREMLALFR